MKTLVAIVYVVGNR